MKTKANAKTRAEKPPPTREALHEAALAYLARSAAATAAVRRVLARRVSTWAREATRTGRDAETVAAEVIVCGEAIETIVTRFAEVGLLDDAAYARARAESLARAGRSRRAIAWRLTAKGIDAETVRDALPKEIDGESELVAALALAKKRRFGPYARSVPDDRDAARAAERRALAVMARAGFAFRISERALRMDLERAESLLTSSRRSG
jgi:regulatory protein